MSLNIEYMAKTLEQWVKIGEITKSSPAFKRGLYSRYAVMEYIKPNGDRKYKEVHIATYEYDNIKTQEE